MEDDELLRKLVEALVSLLESALHSLDSAVHVAMLVPDWEKRYEQAQNNLLLRQHSEDVIAPLKLAVADVLAGRGHGKALDEALQQLKRKPN